MGMSRQAFLVQSLLGLNNQSELLMTTILRPGLSSLTNPITASIRLEGTSQTTPYGIAAGEHLRSATCGLHPPRFWCKDTQTRR